MARSDIAQASAIALYFGGALVEALGVGLIAAYDWVVVGGALAICGLIVATIGNMRWPGPRQMPSSMRLLQGAWR